MDSINLTNSVAAGVSLSSRVSSTPMKNTKDVLASHYMLTEEEAKVYWQVLNAYEKETGIDFASNHTLKFHTIFVLGVLARNEHGRLGSVLDETIRGYDYIADYLKEQENEFGVRDEAWVKRVYSLTDSPEDLEFMAYQVDSYKHLTAFISRLIDAMPVSEKGEFSSRILSVPISEKTRSSSSVELELDQKIAEVYQGSKVSYQYESGVSFESEPLSFITAQILQEIKGIRSNIDDKDVSSAKIARVIDLVQALIKDVANVDADWVKRNYRIADETDIGKMFVAKTAESYKHLIEFLKRFIGALQQADDPNIIKNQAFHRLLDIKI